MDELQQIKQAQAQNTKKDDQPSAQEEALQSAISQILTQSARERLNRVKIVNPERATQVQQMIVKVAQSGQLPGKIDEPQLISLLEGLSKREQSSKLVFKRHDYDDEDDVIQESHKHESDSDDFFD